MIHKYRLSTACLLLCILAAAGADESRRALVLLSDFGLTEHFVASMKGVALGVDPSLQLHDLTHQIEPFNIWQASYMLAVNSGNFARQFGVKAGADWTIRLIRVAVPE